MGDLAYLKYNRVVQQEDKVYYYTAQMSGMGLFVRKYLYKMKKANDQSSIYHITIQSRTFAMNRGLEKMFAIPKRGVTCVRDANI